MCDKCFGTGLIEGPDPKVCKVCGGTGKGTEVEKKTKKVEVEITEPANEPAEEVVETVEPKKPTFFGKKK